MFNDAMSSDQKSNIENGGPSSAPQVINCPGTLGAIALSFSVYTNSGIIFTMSDKNATSSLNGLRFLSMGWIIMVHTALFGLDIIGMDLVIITFFQRIIMILMNNLVIINVIISITMDAL